MLKDSLVGNITLKEKVPDWRQAIRTAAQKLLEKEYIEDKYIGKMIENVEKLGPYIILSDDVQTTVKWCQQNRCKMPVASLKSCQ